MSSTPRKLPLWRRILKASLLTLLAIVLFIVGMFAAMVGILRPEKLTPLVERLANNNLTDAQLELGRVELSFGRSFPFLNLDVQHMVLRSTIRNSLSPAQADSLPSFADTLFAVDRFNGGLNVPALVLNKVAISDITIDNPRANFVVINDSVTNFNIVETAPDTIADKPFDWKALPRISISRFAIVNPGDIRYLDLHTGTAATARLKAVNIDGSKQPQYSIAFAGALQSPLFFDYVNLDDVQFALDGTLNWDSATPWLVSADNFTCRVANLSSTVSTKLNVRDNLTFESLDIRLHPVQLTNVLAVIPESVKKAYAIPSKVETNLQVEISARLSQPYVAGGTALPHGVIHIVIPDAQFEADRLRFDNIALDMSVTLPTDNLNDLSVDIRRLHVHGPATGITVRGTATSLMDDPLFDGRIDGTCDLAKLPPILVAYIPGSVTGQITAEAHIKGRPSMLQPTQFHKLKVDGKFDVSRLYWISSDTVNMAYINNGKFTFNTHGNAQRSDGTRATDLLATRVTVDSAAIMHSDILMHVLDFSLGLATQNRKIEKTKAGEKPKIIPMGGGIRIGQFNLLTLTDSVVLRVRDAHGVLTVAAHNNDVQTPEFNLDLGIDRFSTGDRTTRAMFSNAKTHINAYRSPQGRAAEAVSSIVDSLRNEHPHLSPDSLYALAVIRHNEHRKKYPRVHPEMEGDSIEVIDFGTSTLLKRMLTQWKIQGNLTADRAGLFTPMFPIRNRVRNVDITFNNDTMSLNSIQYKAGHSDFTLSGRITNMRRALTSARKTQPLRVNLRLASDTVDINQLTQTAFSGAAYAAAAEKHKSGIDLTQDIRDDDLDRLIGEHVQAAPDSMAPLLIPRNVEANLKVSARNVMYADLILHNLRGDVLASQGALNLNRLSASSDVGSLQLNALYVGRDVDDLSFGFGLQVNRFNIHRFLNLVPAVDSLMPVLRDFSGVISADIAATSKVKPSMDLDMPTLDAAIQLKGDSLVLIDPDTFKSLAKWLVFKDKNRNIIDHMDVQMLVRDNKMEMYPFIFDIDRYKLGVQGTNDFAMNFNYHIAVLKSPIPFKFGINISGNPDKYKIRLGGAKFNERTPLQSAIVDTVRVNLVRNIGDVFRRGVNQARFAGLKIDAVTEAAAIDLATDTLTRLDSLRFIQEGLIPAPDTVGTPADNSRKGKRRTSKKQKASLAPVATLPVATALAAVRRRKEDAQ